MTHPDRTMHTYQTLWMGERNLRGGGKIDRVESIWGQRSSRCVGIPTQTIRSFAICIYMYRENRNMALSHKVQLNWLVGTHVHSCIHVCTHTHACIHARTHTHTHMVTLIWTTNISSVGETNIQFQFNIT